MLKKEAITNYLLKKMLSLPYIGKKLKAKIDLEIRESLSLLKVAMSTARNTRKPVRTLPEEGLSATKIREHITLLNLHYHPGRCSSTVYTEYDEELSHLLQFVWSQTALINPLYSEWPLINLMEAELISMCQRLLNGKSGAPGILSQGGTMSILEACKSYVLYARKKGIKKPIILAPESIHVAFDKAADILNARLIKIPLNSETGTIEIAALKKCINKNVCLIAASAPSFPCGVIDPIADIAMLASKYRIPLHVDACLGGFITVFAKEAGFDLPPCDFSVPGVTSVSIGTHKYGQTPNGTSLLLFNENCPATPTHVHLDWIGGVYVTPSIEGTRSGADIAAAWAVLCFKGKNEYLRETKIILELKEKLVSEIKKMEDVYIPYLPKLTIIPIYTKNGINPLVVASHLKETKGWVVNILQTVNNKAIGFHFCLTAVHANQAGFFDLFISSLHEAIQYAKNHPYEQPKGLASAYVKLGKGVPLFIKEKMGQAYVRMIQNL